MKVKCVANSGEDLSEQTIKLGYSKDSKFNIEIGETYNVYSMTMWKGSLDYLLCSKETPSWFPAELFEVTDYLLPFMWFFTFDKYKNYKGEESQMAIWGYKEMISDSEHYVALTEGKPEALEVFFERKRQIDEFEEQNQFKFRK